MSKVMIIARGIMGQEMRSIRVIMGYLLGLTFLALGLYDFMRYIAEIGEPVNIGEAFIVTANHGMAGRFWILGYLLIIADAPFVKGNTYMLLYRSGRRAWNMGMLLYVFLQALWYTVCFAAVSALVSIPHGFSGGLWSSPVYLLAKGETSAIAEKYQVYFDGVSMMRHMTVPQAFGITFLYVLCYFVLLGVLLYVCNLVVGGFWGLAAVAVVHLGGISISFLARGPRCLVYYIDGAGGHWRYLGIILIIILAMAAASLFAVGRVDIQARTEGGA
ncbi:MAG: hypothetical protein NC245_01160 [Muribaculum sp.]|nr:hypothetical protein [Muribaculum sp.]